LIKKFGPHKRASFYPTSCASRSLANYQIFGAPSPARRASNTSSWEHTRWFGAERNLRSERSLNSSSLLTSNQMEPQPHVRHYLPVGHVLSAWMERKHDRRGSVAALKEPGRVGTVVVVSSSCLVCDVWAHLISCEHSREVLQP